jgi:nucleoside-diphosphate-sugar epimerase
VHAVSRRPHPELSSVIWHSADLLAPATAPALIAELAPSHILHSAWTTAHDSYWSDPNNLSWLDATTSLADSFARGGGVRFVMVGTCAEYNWDSPDLECGSISEDMAQGQPLTLYGKSKRQASDRLSEIFRSSGLEFANGRVFYPIGPGEHPNRFLPMVIRSLLAGRKPQLGPATQIRDVIDVRDVGRALGMLVGSRLVGVVNIASGISTRLSDVAIQIGNRMSRADLIRVGREVPPAGDPPRLVADVTKLTAQLGFKPQYAIADTLDAAIAFWKARDGDVQSTGSQYA